MATPGPGPRGKQPSSFTNRTNAQQRNIAQQVHDLLHDPSLFPDEFKTWIPRWLYNNVNFTITKGQLPKVENRHLVGTSGEVAFQNGWVNFGPGNEQTHYYIDFTGRVFVGGTVKSGTVGLVPAFNLPAGYRPQETQIYAVDSNSALGVVVITAGGDVEMAVGSNVFFSLSGINFRQYA